MSQQINLFNPVFLKQRRHFSALTMMQGLALILAGALLVALYARLKLHEVDAQAKASAAQLVQTKAQLAKVTADYPPRQKNKELEQQVAQLEAEIRSQRQAMAVVRRGDFGSGQGYAEYMRAFSRQIVQGVWLTGFSIAGNGTDIEVRGRTLQPESVPAYIGRLRAEPVMQGKSFANLSMNTPAEEQSGQPGAVREKTPAPGYLEFALRSSDAGTGDAAGQAGATAR